MNKNSKLQQMPDYAISSIAHLMEPHREGLRDISKNNVEAIRKSVESKGLLNVTIFNVKVDQYGRILGGRNRITAAKALGFSWPTSLIPVEDDRQAIFIAYLDNSGGDYWKECLPFDVCLDMFLERALRLNRTIYVIGSDYSPLVKIGIARNANSRLADIQRMSPVPLKILSTIVGSKNTEQYLHNVFADKRKWGEWFDLGPDPVEAVNAALR